MESTARNKTALHERHESLGAVMSEFAGWRMPLWYKAGAIAEHRAVIMNAGLFDTAHMSIIRVSGPDAFKLLQRCFTRDLSRCVGKDRRSLVPGRAVYGAFLHDQGHTLDDAVVYHISDERYLCIVNAGMGGPIVDHLGRYGCDCDCLVTDESDRAGKVDIQGPHSARVLRKILTNGDDALSDMPYFTFKGHYDTSVDSSIVLNNGIPALLSRSGYTGEFGFEIVVRSENLGALWDALLAAGEEFGILPCGLAARDSLRTGAVLPLSHQDIGPWPFINNPWSIALPWKDSKTGFTKSFVGDSVLEARDRADHTSPFVGYDPRKVEAGDTPAIVLRDGAEIGIVLTCVNDMAIGRVNERVYSMADPDKPADFKPRGLCCGFVKTREKLQAGDTIELQDRRRSIPVVVADDIRPLRTARRPMAEML